MIQYIKDEAAKRKYAREYYKANKDKSLLYSKLHSEKRRLVAAAWRKANRLRYLAQQAAYDRNKRGKSRDKLTNSQ